MTARATVLIAAVLLIGCADDGERSDLADSVQRRMSELNDFEVDPALSGQQCDDLSVSNGVVQVDATQAELTRAVQTAQPVQPTALHLSVQFGSDFPSFTCTDIASEVHNATVDETWPATATSATFTVVEGVRCSEATLQLVAVVARAPDGRLVSLGDISITNEAWQWWPPFECRLVDDSPDD